jgi:flagellar hook-associated protein 2
VTSVQEFVDAFNAVRSFISENDLVTQDESTRQSIFGPLASLSLDENLMSSLRNSLTSASVTGGLSNSLADLGITTERDGSLKLDQAKLTTAIGDDPESVRSIMMNLGDDVAGVDGLVAQYTRFGGLIDSAQSTFNGQIDSYTKSIERSEEYLDRQKQTMTAQYARLEAVIGKMNSQQSALAGLV